MGVEYRYELKYVITEDIAVKLKKQLSLVMEKDPHSVSDEYSYFIRSCYFDDVYNSAYYEKVDGVEFRKKYRIRMYNNDPSMLRLECKHKDGNMTYKEDKVITYHEAKHLLKKEYDRITDRTGLMEKFIADARTKGLQPAVIVDYKRLAFTYPLSEVRITFDMDLHSGRRNLDFFNPDLVTFPIYPEKQMVLEVKCNEYIPAHILAILNSYPMTRQAVSKFALCSEYK